MVKTFEKGKKKVNEPSVDFLSPCRSATFFSRVADPVEQVFKLANKCMSSHCISQQAKELFMKTQLQERARRRVMQLMNTPCPRDTHNRLVDGRHDRSKGNFSTFLLQFFYLSETHAVLHLKEKRAWLESKG